MLQTDVMESDLESTDSLLNGEKDFDSSSYQPRRQRSWLHILGYLIVGIIPATIVWFWMSKMQSSCSRSADHPHPVPEFPTEIRTFEWNYTFTGLRNPASERAWNSILPFKRGYVFVENPSEYSLPPGEKSLHGEIYSVALYHQLHCLTVIRRDYFNLLEGIWNNATGVRDEAFKQIDNSHNRHCLDYIRQTLECAADMTIEWERTETDGSRFQVDGMHIPHVCKSKTALYQYMEEQRVKVIQERNGKEHGAEHVGHGH